MAPEVYPNWKNWNGMPFNVKSPMKRKIEKIKRKFWFIIHNVVAHPMLVTGKKWANRFHDWTAEKI